MTQKEKWPIWAVCLVLGLGAIALYSRVFSFGFVNYDDQFYVINNPHLNKGLSGIFGWAFGSGYGNIWQPVTWFSHALDSQIYGLKPAGHHATNLILHALNSVLVFLVLRQLTGAFWRSAAVAAFFAWHPLHVEALAWVADRKGLLCAFFWLLSLWTYARYVEDAKARLSQAKFYYIGSVILFALALMSNLAAVTLPLIMLLLDWWPLGRMVATEDRSANKRAFILLGEKIPFFVLAIASSVIAFLAIDPRHHANPLDGFSLKTRCVTTVLSYFHFLAKSVWPINLGPSNLSMFHHSKWQLVGIALTLAIISIVAIANRKTRPFWLVGWLWFLIALFPLMTLFPVVAQLMEGGTLPIADCNMYLPSIGLWMLFCWEAYDLAMSWRLGRTVLGGVCAVLLVTCCVASSMQLSIWKNEGTYLARIPDSNINAIGHADYATYLLRRNQLPQAQLEAEKAVTISPNVPTFWVLLGDTLLAQRKFDQSIEKFQSALRLENTLDIARLELGQAFMGKNRVADAAEEFKMVLRHDPHNYIAHHWLARTFMVQGRTADAVAEYSASLKSQVNQPIVLNDLAWLLATDPHPEIRRGAEAVQLANRACALTRGQEPVFLGTLAAAFAETGDFDKAVQAGQRAHDLASAQGLKALAETNLQLVALYRAHKPYREKK